MHLRPNQSVAGRFVRATQHTDMYLIAARKTLGEPQQCRYHPLVAATIKATRHDQNDLHILPPKQIACKTYVANRPATFALLPGFLRIYTSGQLSHYSAQETFA